MADDFSGNTVTLYFKGSPYYARDVRYWLRSKADGFVYGSDEDTTPLEPDTNAFVGIWDRLKGDWV